MNCKTETTNSKVAMRSKTHSKGLMLAMALTLAVGAGANIAIFNLARGEKGLDSIPTGRYIRYQPVGMEQMTGTKHESKTKLLDAAMNVIRAKGYAATRIEDICEAAGLTKGSFFHHFKSKEDLALAVGAHWGVVTGELFASAPYRMLPDPLDRLLAYVDFRKALLQGELAEFTCFAGTMIQEIYETHPAIRDACGKSLREHAATLEFDIAEAMRRHGIEAAWTAASLALYTQAVIQGAFVLAKAAGGPDVATGCLDHLRRYLAMLFTQPELASVSPAAGKFSKEPWL